MASALWRCRSYRRCGRVARLPDRSSRFDWGQTFHPRSLEFCLNLQGHGEIGTAGKTRGDYAPGNCGYYAIGDEPLAASRRARDRHQFVTLEFSRKHLQEQLADCEGDLDPQMRAAVFPEKEKVIVSQPRPMTVAATRCGGDAGAAAGAESGADSLVSEQSARAHGAFSFSAEGSGVFLHAPESGSRAIGSSARKNCSRAIWPIRRRWKCSARKWDAARFI